MEKMPRRYLRRVREAPRFLEAVRKAKRKKPGAVVRESLDSFADDPFLLYSCLWYAYSRGVPVLFQAPPPDAPAPYRAPGIAAPTEG